MGEAAAQVVARSRSIGRVCIAIIGASLLAILAGAWLLGILCALIGLAGLTATRYLIGRYS